MVPKHYFEVICCPDCRTDLQESSDELQCSTCRRRYPVVNGIPVLISGSDDEVSGVVAKFYASAWKRDDGAALAAKVLHEDTSDLGQRYIHDSEARFLDLFENRGRYFLDAACGAQPRVQFGQHHRYHICLDFSLDGLVESRKLLGDRAICIGGSLLKAPLKDAVCEGILASHCIYHIDKDRQHTALQELLRVLSRQGRLLVFYANPANRESCIDPRRRTSAGLLLGLLRRLWNSPQDKGMIESRTGLSAGELYFYLHRVDWMLDALASQGHDVAVKAMRLVVDSDSQAVFKSRLGRCWFYVLSLLEKLYADKAHVAYFLAYVVSKNAAFTSREKTHSKSLS
jgi:uncharacterized protein YbaR (Trm112 family)